MVKMGILKSISARGKIKVFSEFIHDVIDGGEKLIVFAYLKEVVMELKNNFPDAVTVTGDDNATQKQNAVDRFQNDPECKLIILNYKYRPDAYRCQPCGVYRVPLDVLRL